jgi:hypothetical protein
MKKYIFKVWFSNCNYGPESVQVRAINQNDALILAQARRVTDGKDYTLHHIEMLK